MFRVSRVAAFATAVVLTACLAVTAQPPGGPGGGKDGKGEGKGGGRGGFGRPQVGQIMPTFIQDTLKLTDDQKKQVADLQKEVDTKLQSILTDDQKKQLKEISERGFGGRGGPGGPGGGFGGGRGGQKKDN